MRIRLRKQYPGFSLDVAFDLKERVRLAILGPSGSGKTTILNLLAGVAKGEVCEIVPPAGRVGYVFQDAALFPNMTVGENVAIGLGKKIKSADMRVVKMLEKCRISHLSERYPGQLSGGEKQRAALARALVYEPKLLLLDEPFSGLDRALRVELWQEMKALLEDFPGRVVLVTHEEEEARALGSDLMVLEQGRIVRRGPAWCTCLREDTDEKGRREIYADSAATSLHKPFPVEKAMTEALHRLGNGGRGVCGPALRSARSTYEARKLLAGFFQVDRPEHVIFTSGVTESLNMAIKGILKPGDRVLTTAMEHNSVLRPLYEMADRGVKLEILPCTPQGTLDMEALRKALEEWKANAAEDRGAGALKREGGHGPEEDRGFQGPVKAVVCTHASNVTGNRNDIRAIGRLCRENGSVFILDAAQTAGFWPISMELDQIDVLCFTGHKSMLGPQGTGGLCLREGIQIGTFKSGGSGIRSFDKKQPVGLPEALEAGTLNGPGIAGLAAGVRFIHAVGMERIRKREQDLARAFYEAVRGLPGVKVYGDFDQEDRAPIVSLNIGICDAAMISDELAEEYGICTRAGAHCAPLMHEHFGTVGQGMVRFSFSYTNTEEEVELMAKAVRKIAAECQEIEERG